MNDRKGRDIFYGVVAIATLIIAMIGATLAYFSITVSSNSGAVNAKAATVSITYDDGDQVVMQAEELIPSSFEVVKSAYEDALTKEGTGQKCLDKNGKEVCSVYRFSISSSGTAQNMIATLNTELNTFKSTVSSEKLALGYALYNVGTGWVETFNATGDSNSKYDLMNNSCSNEDEDETNNCYSTNASGTKIYSNNQVLSIFGKTSEDETVSLSIGSTQTFDLVLFLLDNNEDQNIDQGAEFKGTIKVSLAEGEERITGEWDE